MENESVYGKNGFSKKNHIAENTNRYCNNKSNKTLNEGFTSTPNQTKKLVIKNFKGII